jgi:hypothetical protein
MDSVRKPSIEELRDDSRKLSLRIDENELPVYQGVCTNFLALFLLTISIMSVCTVLSLSSLSVVSRRLC